MAASTRARAWRHRSAAASVPSSCSSQRPVLQGSRTNIHHALVSGQPTVGIHLATCQDPYRTPPHFSQPGRRPARETRPRTPVDLEGPTRQFGGRFTLVRSWRYLSFVVKRIAPSECAHCIVGQLRYFAMNCCDEISPSPQGQPQCAASDA